MAVAGVPWAVGAQTITRAGRNAGDMAMKYRAGAGGQADASDFLVPGIEQAERDGIRVGRMHRDVDPIRGDCDAQRAGGPRTDLARIDSAQVRSASSDWNNATYRFAEAFQDTSAAMPLR